MIFEYTALDTKGKNVTSIIDAPSIPKARERLKSQGLYIVKIEQSTRLSIQQDSVKKGKGFPFFQQISNKILSRSASSEVPLFARQISTLLTAGMPLLRVVSDILDQTEHPHFKLIVGDIKSRLEEGQSFSNALARHSGVFSDMFINMVRVGENLGSLDKVMGRLADIEEKRNILKSKIQSALFYPVFMIVFCICVITFLMVKIVPSLTSMFSEMGRELPLPTRIITAVSSFLAGYWWLLFLIILCGVYFIHRYISTPKGREKLHSILLDIPLVSGLYRKQIVLKFTQNLGILLNSDVDIVRSFEIVKKIVGNVIIEKKIESAATRIREGAPVSKSLAKADFLPKIVIAMMAAGEASDSLDEMLIKIGQVYETELDLTINALTSILQPAIIIIMGFVIGVIVLSIMLPILEMNQLV